MFARIGLEHRCQEALCKRAPWVSGAATGKKRFFSEQVTGRACGKKNAGSQ